MSVSLIQHRFSGSVQVDDTGLSASSLAVGFSSTTTSGSLLLCVCEAEAFADNDSDSVGTTTINTPVTAGITWTLADSSVYSIPGFSPRVSVFYAANAPSIGTGVTTQFSASWSGDGATSGMDIMFKLYEFSGIESSTPLDDSANNSPAESVLITPTTADLSTVQSGLVFVVFAGSNWDSLDPTSIGPGSGYTVELDGDILDGTPLYNPIVDQYALNHPSGSVSTSFTGTTNSNPTLSASYVCVAVAFKGIVTGGGGPTVTVTAVVPNTGPTSGGQLVIIEGTNFVSPSTADFGGAAGISVSVLSPTSIACATPAHAAGPVTVSVTDSIGTGSLANGYTYGAPAPPIVTVVTPNTGPTIGGTSVTITGLNLAPDCTVSFGGDPATGVSVVSGTSILCVTPAHSEGFVNVSVTDSIGTGTLANGYEYLDDSTASFGTAQGCGVCTEPKLLNTIPGFSDLPNSVLTVGSPSFALHLGEISMNAAFGMVRCEIFPCTQKHGDTVPLPVSCADGYVYSREELIYFWSVANSVDPSTGWISGPDSLWFANWEIDQTTGVVFSEEWYERSSTADTRLAAKSNDGSIQVFTIGQRQRTNMIMAAPAAYSTVDESQIADDKPYTDNLLTQISGNAKFSCVNSEVFYLGEYVNGQTVTLPVSSVDRYAYSSAECKFLHAWRWTPDASNYSQPPGAYEQAAPFQASVSSSGVVTIAVSFSTSGGDGVLSAPGYGRVAVFAFANRSASPTSLPLADNFTELDLDFFFPGETVRASTLLQIKKNTDEAILTPEFFGPTVYHDGGTVPLPTSPVDGYVYSRSELQYVWSWSDTTNNSGGTHVRLPLFLGGIDKTNGAVALQCWRMPPGGPWLDDSNVNATITVLVVGTRESSHPEITYAASTPTTPSDAGAFITDVSGDQVNGS